MPPFKRPTRWLIQLWPVQRDVPSLERTSRSGPPPPSESSSAAIGADGPPKETKLSPGRSMRKTPALVTRTGAGNGAPNIAIGTPAGGLPGAVHRSPRSREKRRPEEDDRARTVLPAASRNATRDAAGGSESRETRRTFRPRASQTPLSSPPYARKKKRREGSLGSAKRSETRPSGNPTDPLASVAPPSSE